VTVLNLSHIPAIDLPPLPVDLQGAVISLPFANLCPFCAVRPAGLLEGHCGEPHCRTAYLNADAAHQRSEDHD
jgi:hypothetical protein